MNSYWSAKEDKILKEHYLSAPKQKLLKRLPGRTWESLHHRAFRLGLNRQIDNEWNNADLTILIREYTFGSKEKMQSLLPKHSWGAIRTKASNLGLRQCPPQERPLKGGRIYKADSSILTGNKFQFGIVSDTHFGSKYSQITWLHQFYKILNLRKIRTVFHIGDLSDGNGYHYPGQRFEMHITGADELNKFIIKNYPRLNNGKSYLIAGQHDLDLWTQEGHDLLENVCEKRKDMVYLSQHDAYFNLGDRIIYLLHPAGGTAYALSYKPQKLIESFASENKPHIVIIGHYHKAEYIPMLRNIYLFQAGCFQAQTPFAVKKNIQFHYGGWIIEMTVNDRGISDIKTEFVPFYKPIIDDYKNFD